MVALCFEEEVLNQPYPPGLTFQPQDLRHIARQPLNFNKQDRGESVREDLRSQSEGTDHVTDTYIVYNTILRVTQCGNKKLVPEWSSISLVVQNAS